MTAHIKECDADKSIKAVRCTIFPFWGNWENQLWGSNREVIETLKKKWDPHNRFNCWHCIGYLESSVSQNLTESQQRDDL